MLQVQLNPFPVLETERLYLRRVTLEDAAAIYKLRSDELVMKYIGKPPVKTMSEAIDFIQLINTSLETNAGISWAITTKENPSELIGTIGHWRLMKDHYRAELGYMLQRNYWRQGIMKEAIPAVVEYGFSKMKLHSIEAQIDPKNTASARVLESTGFIVEGYFKESFYYDGEFTDKAVFSMLTPGR